MTTTMSSSLSLDEEARLYTTNAERERYESLATLFGIIVSLDYLERAYVRDAVTAAECVPTPLPLTGVRAMNCACAELGVCSRGILRHARGCCHSTRPC